MASPPRSRCARPGVRRRSARTVLRLVLLPPVPIGRQVGLQLRKDQLDVKVPVVVVDEVQEIGVLLRPADDLDGVGVLKTLVVAECLVEQPEVHSRDVPLRVEVRRHACHRVAVDDAQRDRLPPALGQGHPRAALVERIEQRLRPSGSSATWRFRNTSSSRRRSRSLPHDDHLDVVEQRDGMLEDRLVAAVPGVLLPLRQRARAMTGDIVVPHLAEGVVVVADGVLAPQEPLLEVEPRLFQSSSGRELADAGEDVARAAGPHVRCRRHAAHRDTRAHFLHRAHHRAAVAEHRVDERRQVFPIGQRVVESVALHLFLEVLIREIEPVLVPVARRLAGGAEGPLVLAQWFVALHAGQEDDARRR